MKGSYNSQIYQTGRYKADPQIRTITDRAQWAIVDRKHKLVYHKDGYNLLFARKRDAEAWLSTYRQEIPEDWRVLRVDTSITEVSS